MAIQGLAVPATNLGCRGVTSFRDNLPSFDFLRKWFGVDLISIPLLLLVAVDTTVAKVPTSIFEYPSNFTTSCDIPFQLLV